MSGVTGSSRILPSRFRIRSAEEAVRRSRTSWGLAARSSIQARGGAVKTSSRGCRDASRSAFRDSLFARRESKHPRGPCCRAIRR